MSHSKTALRLVATAAAFGIAVVLIHAMLAPGSGKKQNSPYSELEGERVRRSDLQTDGYIVPRGIDLPPELPNRDTWTYCQIVVTNRAKDTPGLNRRVRVYWQWTKDSDTQPSDDGWSSTNMTCTSLKPDPIYGFPDEGEYEAWIPPQKPGYMWYYYEVKYDGYWWSGKMQSTGPVVEDDPGPVYLGDDVSSHASPGTEGFNPGRHKVNVYRTRFTQVKVPIEE